MVLNGSLVSFAGLLSASGCTAVQIHAKLIIELKRTFFFSKEVIPLLCRLGEVAMLSDAVVLHLSRPVEVMGKCSSLDCPLKSLLMMVHVGFLYTIMSM